MDGVIFNIYMFTTTCFIDRIKIHDKSNLSPIKFWHICCELHYLAAGDSCPLKSCMENKNDLEAEFQRRVKMDAGPTGFQVTFGKDLFTFSCRYVSYCFILLEFLNAYCTVIIDLKISFPILPKKPLLV